MEETEYAKQNVDPRNYQLCIHMYVYTYTCIYVKPMKIDIDVYMCVYAYVYTCVDIVERDIYIYT